MALTWDWATSSERVCRAAWAVAVVVISAAWARASDATIAAYVKEQLGPAAVSGRFRPSVTIPMEMRQGHVAPWPGPEAAYWAAENRRVWIIRSRGKMLPLLVAVTIEEGTVRHLRVLEDRNAYGKEATRSRYLQTFEGLRLEGDTLSRRVDSVTGATFTARGIRWAVHLALLLDQAFTQASTPQSP